MAIAPDRLHHASETTPAERDLHIAWLLGIAPDRVRTVRRVHAKFATLAEIDGVALDLIARRVGLRPKVYRCWRRLEEMADVDLEAEMRNEQALERRSNTELRPSRRRP